MVLGKLKSRKTQEFDIDSNHFLSPDKKHSNEQDNNFSASFSKI